MVENGKEISVAVDGRRFSLTPTNIKEAMDLAQWIAKSDLAPKDFKDKPQNCLIAMQMGLEVGLSPMQAIQNIAVINGRPSVWGDSMLAICQVHRDFESNDENESTNEKGVCVVKRRGVPAQRREFSIDDAKKAGLWGKAGPWTTNPPRMLKLRARAFALRDTFADALRGLQSAEEVTDYVDTTATRTVVPETTTVKTEAAAPEVVPAEMKKPTEKPKSNGTNEGLFNVSLVIESLQGKVANGNKMWDITMFDNEGPLIVKTNSAAFSELAAAAMRDGATLRATYEIYDRYNILRECVAVTASEAGVK